jgi:hypothetical protein
MAFECLPSARRLANGIADVTSQEERKVQEADSELPCFTRPNRSSASGPIDNYPGETLPPSLIVRALGAHGHFRKSALLTARSALPPHKPTSPERPDMLRVSDAGHECMSRRCRWPASETLNRNGSTTASSGATIGLAKNYFSMLLWTCQKRNVRWAVWSDNLP